MALARCSNIALRGRGPAACAPAAAARQVPTPAAAARRRAHLVLVRAKPGAKTGEDNPYHDRQHTRSRRSNPGGTKDAGVTHRDKDEQFALQQERLEWRRKNQFEGKEEREEPPHNNLARDEYSAERRGPDVEGSSGHGDTLKEFVENVKDSLTGHKHDTQGGGGKQH